MCYNKFWKLLTWFYTYICKIIGCGDDASSDQTLQRLIALGEFDNDSMFSDELRADLGKLDDNMIR